MHTSATASFSKTSVRAARLLIGIVFLWNIQAAYNFIVFPDRFAPGFELSGRIGEGMIQGMGILFLMWNVPYAFALWHPIRHRISLLQTIIMQAIGAAGEIILYLGLPPVFATARASVMRFIVFDTSGLILLLLAGIFVLRSIKNERP